MNKNRITKSRIIKSGALAAALLATLFVASVAVSQPPRGGHGPGADRGHDGGARHRVGRLAQFLELTDAQKEEWKAAHEAQAPIMKELAERVRANRMALHEAIESDDPNPTAIGELTLAGRDIRDEMKASHEQLRATLEATLTPEQIDKWAAYEAAREDRPGRFRGRGGRGHGGPGAGGPGLGDPELGG